MKWRDESIFDSFRFPLRGILSEGKASPSDLISTRHDCARYCRYINLEDDRTRVTIFSRSANFVSRRRGTASFFGRFDRGSSKGKCGRSISFPATIDRLVRIIERPRAKGARENPFLLLPTNPRLKTPTIDLSNHYPLSIRPERRVSSFNLFLSLQKRTN